MLLTPLLTLHACMIQSAAAVVSFADGGSISNILSPRITSNQTTSTASFSSACAGDLYATGWGSVSLQLRTSQMRASQPPPSLLPMCQLCLPRGADCVSRRLSQLVPRQLGLRG